MLLDLELCNYFGTKEVYLFGLSLGILYGLMIGTGGMSLVGLSLVLPLGSPFDSSNTGPKDAWNYSWCALSNILL